MNGEIIYIPFLVFYDDKIVFAYEKYKESGWSITNILKSAFTSADLEEAKKAFSKCLRVLCPRDLWDYSGIIKTTRESINNYIPKYSIHDDQCEYLHYSDTVKDFEVIKVQS